MGSLRTWHLTSGPKPSTLVAAFSSLLPLPIPSFLIAPAFSSLLPRLSSLLHAPSSLFPPRSSLFPPSFSQLPLSFHVVLLYRVVQKVFLALDKKRGSTLEKIPVLPSGLLRSPFCLLPLRFPLLLHPFSLPPPSSFLFAHPYHVLVSLPFVFTLFSKCIGAWHLALLALACFC